MLFFPSKEDNEYIAANNLNLYMENNAITRVKTVKFLGVIIDECMNFRQHVDSTIKKIKSVNGLLYRRRDYLSHSCRKDLFFALVQSRLQYCIVIYGNTTWNILQPLYIACNRTLRTLQGLTRFSHVKDMYLAYNVLPVHLLHKFYCAILIYKCVNNIGTMSIVTYNMFKLNNASHDYPTRLSQTNHLYKKTGPAFSRSYVNAACTDWNNIPLAIRNETSLYSFMKEYKKYLFNTWQV